MPMIHRVGFGLVLAVALATGCRPADPPPAAALPAAAVAPATAAVVADVSLGAGFELGATVVDDRVALVPIIALAPATDRRDYLLLTDGMTGGRVSVREVPGEWIVETLAVHNQSRRPVLALRGELLLDGFQDRVIAASRIIAPGAREDVEVRCVEADRDGGDSRTFRAGAAIAELALRRTLRWSDQSAVWKMVDTINERHGLAPPTETYRHAAARQHAGAGRDRRDRVLARLAAAPRRAGMVGIAVAIDGRVIAIEHFASPALYRAVEPRLVASYLAVTDVDAAPPATSSATVTPYAVRALASWPGAATTTEASTEIMRPIDPTPRD